MTTKIDAATIAIAMADTKFTPESILATFSAANRVSEKNEKTKIINKDLNFNTENKLILFLSILNNFFEIG